MSELKKRIERNLSIYYSSFAAMIILTLIVFFLPVEFSSYTNEDSLAPIWYFITETGGFYGSSAIMIILLIFLLISFKRFTKRAREAFYFITLVFLIQIFINGMTLFFVKDLFQNPRPSQEYFVEKGFVDIEKKEFFMMPSSEKRKYLQNRFDSLGIPENVYPPIFKNWIIDSGYSFPSGHSQTGFFLGTILSFVIYRMNPKQYYFLIPLAWEILVSMSRVVIGVHYPVDVTAGAFIGFAAASVIISFKKINIIFEFLKKT